MIRTLHNLSSDFAAALVRTAIGHATKVGINVCVAVVGRDGNPLALQRMDAASILCLNISLDKAKTAATFGMATRELHRAFVDTAAVRDGLPHFPGFTFLGGGCPVKWQGEVVGGIGVSGGSEEQDIECAESALELLNQSMPSATV
jgi:uncharacterized protein GlcG (DUF336 family)